MHKKEIVKMVGEMMLKLYAVEEISSINIDIEFTKDDDIVTIYLKEKNGQ